MMTRTGLFARSLLFIALAAVAAAQAPPPETLRLRFESDSELLSDFVSQSERYKALGREGLDGRELAIGEGRFGNGIHIKNGAPFSRGTWNESGLECDLIVAVVWGEWHKKPHYWGAGAFHGDRGTVAFWVKADKLIPGEVFLQSGVAWGRKERDVFSIEVDEQGRFRAKIRDIQLRYHAIETERPLWRNGEWQHIAVVYDRAHGLSLYYNGELAASNWGQDAWWQAPLPGLFSPFLEQSRYDEICFFDTPLTAAQVRELYTNNAVTSPEVAPGMDEAARRRLLAAFGAVDTLALPEIKPREGAIALTQVQPADARDGAMPVWWTFDGRYELAWPHPYRLFTFILGDADFHGTRLDIELGKNGKPDYLFFEGMLGGLEAVAGNRSGTERALLKFSEYAPLFYSLAVDFKNVDTLSLPFVKEYGSPADLEGSAHIPLTGETRIHEIGMWRKDGGGARPRPAADLTWALEPMSGGAGFGRYDAALQKLKTRHDRQVIAATDYPSGENRAIALEPLQSVFITDPGLRGDIAVDTVRLELTVRPRGKSDVFWLKLRDPANPARLWAQCLVRAVNDNPGHVAPISVELNIIDLMLAAEDRLLVELMSAEGCELLFGPQAEAAGAHPSLSLTRARGEDALAHYTKHELHAARMQYTKEYNYRPWLWTGETIDIQNWRVFGGPYDMAYPVLAVLRHDPGHSVAQHMRTLLFERRWFGSRDDAEGPRKVELDAPESAPDWAAWQLELLALNQRVVDWIVTQQRPDGNFWGGPNDDSFIPLGWAALPLLGHDEARRSWLRFYDGLEEQGIYHDGYCDIWPIDPLHITDYIASRPIMMLYDIGNPRVIERELRTAEQYTRRVADTNAERAARGLPPITGLRDDRGKQAEATLVQQMEAEIRNYARAHLGWYWGEAAAAPPHSITDRAALAHEIREIVQRVDETAIFGFTEARVHTDNQRGIGRDVLMRSALGGRVQNYCEPFPPSIAVSWDGAPVAGLARLVSYADEKTIRMNLFNTGRKAVDFATRVWQLEPGVYRVRTGADRNDDGRIDVSASAGWELSLKRFSTIPLTAPPGVNTAVEITQIRPEPQAPDLPDLAISAADIRVLEDGRLEVIVHNLGARPADQIEVDVVTDSGESCGRQTIERLESPRVELTAQRVAVTFDEKAARQGGRVVVDPEGHIAELYRGNNSALISSPSR